MVRVLLLKLWQIICHSFSFPYNHILQRWQGSPSSCSFCYSVLGPFSFVRRKQRCLEFTCSELVSALSSLSSFSPFGSFTVSESLTKLDEEFSTKIWYFTPIPCWIPCYLYTTSLLSLWKSSIYHLSKYTISSILKIV